MSWSRFHFLSHFTIPSLAPLAQISFNTIFLSPSSGTTVYTASSYPHSGHSTLMIGIEQSKISLFSSSVLLEPYINKEFTWLKWSAQDHAPGIFSVPEVDSLDSTPPASELKNLAFGLVGFHEVLAGPTEEHAMFLEKVVLGFECNPVRIVLATLKLTILLFIRVLWAALILVLILHIHLVHGSNNWVSIEFINSPFI